MCAQLVKPTTAPSDHALSSIAGAFAAIRMGNTAIRLQPALPTNKDFEKMGLGEANASLQLAQAHAKDWGDTISGQVQNQLQSLIDYNMLYNGLASSINSAIEDIAKATPQNPPTNLASLAAELGAMQTQVQALLYGAGGSATNPLPASSLGTFNALTAYQTNVSNDAKVFGKYHDIATSSTSGISADIQNMMNDIKADNNAIATDRLVIAGGALGVVLGALVIIVAVALAPFTGGTSVTAVVVGGTMIAAGAGGVIYGAVDLAAKERDIVKKTQQLADDRAELAALNGIGAGVAVYGFAKEVMEYNNEIAETYKKQEEIGSEISAIATEIKKDQLDYATLTMTSSQIGIFNTQVQKVLADMGSILDQMSGWQEQLNLLSDYSKPPSDGFFTQQVNAGVDYWSGLVAQLSRYENIAAQTGVDKTDYTRKIVA